MSYLCPGRGGRVSGAAMLALRRPTGPMKSLTPCLILAAVLMIGGDVAAARTYVAIGAGIDSCGIWTPNRRKYAPERPVTQGSQSVLQRAQWCLGFLSDVGFMGGGDDVDPLNKMDAQGVLAWIDNYCRANPIN
jgi:hypothetical protein